MTTTFHTTDALVDWMQDEGFDELVLLSCRPVAKVKKTTATKRKAAVPDVVVLEVGVVDIEHEGAKDRFFVWRFEATGITQWESTGALGKHEALTLERADDVDAPIVLRFVAGGRALLACTQIDVVDAGPRLRTARPRPWQTDFRCDVPELLVLGELLDAVAVPGAVLKTWRRPIVAAPTSTMLAFAEHHDAFCLFDGEREVVSLLPHHYRPNVLVSFQRRAGATDDEWDRVWALPVRFAVVNVNSRTLTTTPADWAKVQWRDGMT